MDICPKCGLPLHACVCTEIAREQQEIEVRTENRRFGKITTIVAGIKEPEIWEIAKKLKSKLACGGTVKNKAIELQGEHKNKVKTLLVEMGFDENKIKN